MTLLQVLWPFWAGAAGLAFIADQTEGTVLRVVLGVMASCLVVLPVWALVAED